MRTPPTPSLLIAPRQSASPWRCPSQCLRQTQRHRAYSSVPPDSLIKVRSIPAPHTGLITIIGLVSPTNKNAISRQLLRELNDNIVGIHDQWDKFTGRKGAQNKQKKLDISSGEEGSAQLGVEEIPDKSANEHISPYELGGAITPREVHNSTRVLIMSSEVDKVFCAGADLKERAGMTHQETDQFLYGLRHALGRLATLPIPTISAVSGFALGGGLELALATTFRVFSTTATVGLPETRLGIVPGAGGPMRLSALIGDRRAADLILTGRRIDGREAFNLGLCERLVEDNGDRAKESSTSEPPVDMTLETAVKMAKDICEGGPVAIGAALRLVGGGFGSMGKLPRWEEIMYERVLKTEDRDEALLAFKEKRTPNFRGR